MTLPAEASERRVAFITGAGGGVGAACARRFAPTHRLVLTDANADALTATAAAVATEAQDVQAEAGDLTDRSVVDALAQRTAATGSLGVVVHAAGLSPSMADAWRILEVNLFATINVLDALLPQVEPGSVGICIASIAGWRRSLAFRLVAARPAEPGLPPAALGGDRDRRPPRSRLRAVETSRDPARGAPCPRVGRAGGRLVSVSPGLIIDTAMGQLEAPKGASGLLAASSLKRNASSDDIAGACAMLASPDAAFVTGVDLRVDGGSIAGYWHHSDPETAAAWDDPAY